MLIVFISLLSKLLRMYFGLYDKCTWVSTELYFGFCVFCGDEKREGHARVGDAVFSFIF
jgi:hypothetical protein